MTSTAEHRFPPPLAPGDTIGIFAPAGPVADPRQCEAGLRLLHQAGFQLRHAPDLLQRRDGYLAGDDAARAAELLALWRDPEVKGLVALRGGYGCLRLLDRLDWELIRRQPKQIIGFSDLTVLHAAILRKSEQITLHGPMVATLGLGDGESVEHFFLALTGRLPPRLVPKGLEILRPGQARGRLAGGNLACLSHLLGTPYEPLWDNAILLLEDTGEAAYRLDRMLTHLALAGRLARVAAVILGDLGDCENQEEIWQRLLELTADRPIPLWAGFPSGHGRRNLTLPLGCAAELDSQKGELRLLPPG